MKTTTLNKIRTVGTAGLIAMTLMSAGCKIREDQGTEYTKKTFDTAESFDSLNIKEIEGDVRFGLSSDKETHITYYDCKYYDHNVEVSNNELKYTANQKKDVANFLGRLIDFTTKDIETEILLPENEFKKLDLSVTTGDVTLDNNFTFDEGNIELTTGNLDCDATFNNSLVIDCVTGNINVDSNKSTELENIRIKTVTGSINVNGFNSKKIKLDATTGSIKFSELTADKIDIDVTTGKINGKITDEYDIDASCTAGSCKTDSTANADRTIHAECVSGSITIQAD